MASRDVERIRLAALGQNYNLTEHALDEVEQDNLDVIDKESALITGQIEQTLTQTYEEIGM